MVSTSVSKRRGCFTIRESMKFIQMIEAMAKNFEGEKRLMQCVIIVEPQHLFGTKI